MDFRGNGILLIIVSRLEDNNGKKDRSAISKSDLNIAEVWRIWRSSHWRRELYSYLFSVSIEIVQEFLNQGSLYWQCLL